MKLLKQNILKQKEVIKMQEKIVDTKIANLSREQQEKINKIESELGCILVAYEKKQNFV